MDNEQIDAIRERIEALVEMARGVKKTSPIHWISQEVEEELADIMQLVTALQDNA